jgi:hypothetical protein
VSEHEAVHNCQKLDLTDAEAQIVYLEAHHGQKWAAEDSKINQTLAGLPKKYHTSSNIHSWQ